LPGPGGPLTTTRPLTFDEELANAVTHGVGLLGCLAGVPVLLLAALARGDSWQVIGCSVFAATLLALYSASTLYHALPPSRAKQTLQVIDHAAIYLLIAGTYTPFTIGVLRGAWGWTLFGIVWSLAACGVLFKSLFGMRFPRVSTAFYLAMGWLAIIAVRPLTAELPGAGLGLLLAGGLLYTIGVGFFVWERPRYSHTVWHLFVLAGSTCHFLAVLWYAVPGPA
jgi:hemolysin III